MTVADWLIKTIFSLKEAGVDSPRRDALVLLEDTLGKDRAWVVTHPEYKILGGKLQKVNQLVNRRLKREPLAYVRGKAWFYARFFGVSPSVMIPRPESESFIEILKEIKPKTVVDIGTGSGCLAITAKLEIPAAEIIAVDDSKNALAIAKKNALKHNVEINFLNGDLLEPIKKIERQLDNVVLLANLPYVPQGLVTSPEISQEPAEALFSGTDGLDHYRRFFGQIAKNSQFIRRIRIDYVMTEALESQHPEMTELAKTAGYELVRTDLLVQLFKTFR